MHMYTATLTETHGHTHTNPSTSGGDLKRGVASFSGILPDSQSLPLIGKSGLQLRTPAQPTTFCLLQSSFFSFQHSSGNKNAFSKHASLVPPQAAGPVSLPLDSFIFIEILSFGVSSITDVLHATVMVSVPSTRMERMGQRKLALWISLVSFNQCALSIYLLPTPKTIGFHQRAWFQSLRG